MAAPFKLPEGWEEGLEVRSYILDRISNGDVDLRVGPNRSNLGKNGNRNGKGKGHDGFIDMWTVQAGEEPDLSSLSIHPHPTPQAPTIDQGQDERGVNGDEWYCHLVNVEAVWTPVWRHRLQYRQEREEVMYLLKGSSLDDMRHKQLGCIIKAFEAMGDKEIERVKRKKDKLRGRRRRREVDILLDSIKNSV